jgi:hypothetical protein
MATATNKVCATGPSPVFHKDTDATLDYIWDWSDWLGDDNDILATSVFISSAPTILEIEMEAFNDTTATVWLSGGEPYTEYLVTNRVHTMGGRTEDRTARIFCISR